METKLLGMGGGTPILSFLCTIGGFSAICYSNSRYLYVIAVKAIAFNPGESGSIPGVGIYKSSGNGANRLIPIHKKHVF